MSPCNHGGVITAPGYQLRLVQLDVSPTSLEHVSGRITFSTYSCTIVVIYRTGAIYDCFFNEFSDLLDRAAVPSEDVVVRGDFNIRIRSTSSCLFIKLLL